ncbi:MAG TPA: hypothetical protein VMT35_15250, partial [Ignavibacteriaceae bacterium]|nr:hypothetical protein [Ignavibacteriaceae bacterium]
MIKNYLSGKIRPNYLIVLIIIVFAIPVLLRAQTTGKISGKVIDAETGEPLFGANVVLEGTP